jgi:antitoxin ParD1/3/4
MPTRNVILTERQEQLTEDLVKSGRCQNARAVLRDGLRLVEQREAEHRGKLKALRAAARVGIGALDRGEFTEFVAIEDLQAYLNDLSDKVISKIVKWALWPSEDGSFVSPRPQNSSSRIS